MRYEVIYQLGDIATWLAAIGTVGAFFVGFKQIKDEREIRKDNELKDQAVRISAFIVKENLPKTKIELLNLSSEPIYEAIVSLEAFQGAGFEKPSNTPGEYISCLSVIPPGKSFTFIGGGYHGMSFHPSIAMAFKDIKGKNWFRSGRGDLKEISMSPTDFYELRLPISWEIPKQK